MQPANIHHRLVAIIGQDQLELIERKREASLKVSRLRAQVEALGHGRKVVLADLTAAYLAEGTKTVAKAETLARASETYKGHLKATMNKQFALGEAEADFYSLKDTMEYGDGLISYARGEQYQLRER